MSYPCIKILDLHKRYPNEPKDTLKGLNLCINEGHKYGILGPNGAGKTTMISILCGVLEETSGSVGYWGENIGNQIKRMQREIGYVPQDFAIYDDLTPLQNLEYFGSLYDLNKSVIKSRSEELLKVLGLSENKNKQVKFFSGGMKRRVNLAIGLVHSPKVLFLDEPTVGVDIHSKNAIMDYLETLNKNGLTVIYTSHHLDEAQEFCDYITLIDKGENVAQGETRALLVENGVSNLKELLINLTGKEFRD